MDRLDEAVRALKQAIAEGGTAAVVSREPGAKMRYAMPVVSVGLSRCSYRQASFVDYLGLQLDEESQQWEELYGKRLELKFALDIFVPGEMGGNECAAVFDRLCGAVSTLPCGMRALELSCGEVKFDEAAEMFRCGAELKCAVYLCATEDEQGEFRDFRLRGVMINGGDK